MEQKSIPQVFRQLISEGCLEESDILKTQDIKKIYTETSNISLGEFLALKENLKEIEISEDDKIEKIMNPDKEGALCIHGSMWRSPIFAI